MGKYRFNPDKFAKKKKQENNSNRRKADVQRTNTKNENQTVINREDAKAPYNFVPLNKSVIEAEMPPNQDCYYSDRITGHIDCTLETLTPIYIRDSLTQEDLEQKEAIEKDGKKYINSDFFSPGKRLRIPGSSLRGMIRTLVEIATWSKFQFFEDKGLYYRGLADKSNLRNEYQEKMSSFDKKSGKIYKMSAGYLKNIGFQYYIIPAESKNGTQFKQILIAKTETILKGKGLNYSDFIFNALELDNGEHLVISGGMNNKKNDWIIFKKINDSESSKILVSEIDIENYEGDINRTDKANLLKKLKSFPDGIPCFYIQWKDEKGNNRVSFGHTGMFRLAYTKSIGEHVPENLKNEKIIDLTEAIFGKVSEKNKQFFSGRVFFEDTVLINQNENPILEEAIPETLSSPKPTTFQHYLEQESNNIKNLQNYNSNNTNIRGNKLYWHKSGTIWKKYTEFNENIDTKIKPVKPNIKFKFRIRFENLSRNELGALLFALKLPNECAHKLGMGKPLGLGSVKIKPELSISDRKKRYSSLFENEKWSLLENKNSEAEIDNLINLFQKYILGKIGPENENASSLWETSRLKKLKLLLDVEIGKKLEKEDKIRYMSIEPKNEFKERKVLPSPEKVTPL